MKDIIQKIREIIQENGNFDEIEDTESLNEKGIDSIAMLYILNDIENEFNIRIPDDEMLISNFENIQQISNLVGRLLGKEKTNESV